MEKSILFDTEAREALLEGARKMAEAVGSTLGPLGQNVTIERPNMFPMNVHDGVSVAREIVLQDRHENLGAQIVREASEKANHIAGDGTTTAAVLTYAIAGRAHDEIVNGRNAAYIKKGVILGLEEALVHMQNTNYSWEATNDEERKAVATISAQDEIIGADVAAAYAAVGENGLVTVEETSGHETQIEVREGITCTARLASPYFVTKPESGEASLQNPHILLFAGELADHTRLETFFRGFFEANPEGSIVIVADKIDGTALSFLVRCKMAGLRVAGVSMHMVGTDRTDLLDDLHTSTGAVLFGREYGRNLTEYTDGVLGTLHSFSATTYSATFVPDSSFMEAIQAHADSLKESLETVDQYRKEQLQERITRLTAKIALIEVGAETDSAKKELKERYIDAVCAVRSCLLMGVTVGGSMTLIRASKSMKVLKDMHEDIITGYEILRKALRQPFRKMLENAGLEVDFVLSELISAPKLGVHDGFDLMQEKVHNLRKVGIIEPLAVPVTALRGAVSAALTLLTTGVTIVDAPKELGHGTDR